jgi:gliding motility-associated-like protein
VFKKWPPVAICVNYPLDFDHGAIDPDGDSIVYRLCTPFSGATANASMPQPPNKGPYIELNWAPGYSLDNLLGGVPLRIDPKTGQLTGTPNRIGNFVVGICAEEYRKGQLISITRRDFQFNVSDCGTVSAAFFTPNAICDTRSVKFSNTSTLASSYKWFFDWDKNKSLTSNLKDPVFTYPDTGYYNVALIINPGGVCADTFFKKIHVTLSSIDADLEITYPECNGAQLTIKALDKSEDPVHGIKRRLWQLTGPGPVSENSQAKNPEFKVALPGTYTLRLIVTAGNDCQDTLIKTFKVPIPNLEAIKTDYFICKGDSVSIYPNFDPDFDFTWTPQNGLSNTGIGNPKASPDTTTTYKVVVSGDGPCVRTAFVTVNVTDAGNLLATATPDTIFKGQSSQLLAIMPGATFTWSPSNSLSDNKISNPKATPDQTTDYTVEAQIGNNCTLKKTLRIVVLSVICDLPYVFFPNAFSPNGDNENDFLKLEGVLVTEAYWAIYNRWGEKVFEANSVDDTWDGTWRGQPQPAETYGFYLRVRCLGEAQETVKKGNVTLLR